MKKSIIALALIGTAVTSFADVQETVGNSFNGPAIIGTNSVTTIQGSAGVIYDNGPLVNSAGTGIGGEDESVLQTVTLGLNSLGAGHQFLNGNRVADDFTVAGGDWEIESIDFYAYQTGETASTITAVNLRIWDGVPAAPGSNIVFGDDTTNLMTSTGNTGILRVTETTTGTTNNRQIAVSNVAVGITLSPGTYWLDWQSDGSGASGPWAPPITINGQAITGNALQSVDAGVTYADLLDTGTGTPQQGLPFVVYGTLPPPPIVPTLSFYGLLLLGLIALVFGRRFIRQ